MDMQPSFTDLGTPLAATTFVVVDLETTGSSAEDSITEIGAVKVCGGEVLGEFQSLINPHTAIPPLIAVLTGITNSMVAAAPPLSSVLPQFLEFSQGSVLVAHNARFDVGFLKRSCEQLEYPWPGFPVLDTVALARQVLLRDEVPNVKLSTLAHYFHTEIQPTHRALDDARATVDVLYRLMERVGNRGVQTLEDLMEFLHRVSPQRRAKRSLATGLPQSPGVYSFVSTALDRESQVLYVGKSRNLKRRVASYFTSSEKRPRMEEMIRIATEVRHVVTSTDLEADVTELRLIAAHAPRYNRRSKFPQRLQWLKLTNEPFPRFSVVRQVTDDGATYLGPFRHRHQAEECQRSIYEAFPLRQCTDRMSATKPSPCCVLAEMGSCSAPCIQSVSTEQYAAIVDDVRAALTVDSRPVLQAASERLRTLVAQERFEQAAILHARLEHFAQAVMRHHRIASLARVPELVAARRIDHPHGSAWEMHVIRYGRLAAAGVALPGQSPRACEEVLVASAQHVEPGPGPTPAALIEETEQIASWLECEGIRLLRCTGDWFWPIHVGIDHGALPELLLGQRAVEETSSAA